MKLLLVLGSDDSHNNIFSSVKPLGFDLIRYNNILKAMDNIDEIDPSAIIISALDFPRHWKSMVQFVRNERSKESCPIIILKGENFPLEEVSKASFLGVSGIVNESLEISEISRLQGILGRYMPVDEKRRTHRFNTEAWHRFAFAFSRPSDKAVVTGEVKNISLGGLSFLPDIPTMMREITLHMELKDCSLRAGDSIFSPACRLARTGRIVSMEFLSFGEGEMKSLTRYIESLPLKKLRNIERDLAKPANA